MSISILHTADNHLDPKISRYRYRLMDRKRDFWSVFKEIIDYTLKYKPNIMLISGDLFDRVDPRNPPRTKVIQAFRSIYENGTKIFMISGNHDGAKSISEGMSPLSEIAATGYAEFFSSVDEVECKHIRIADLDVCISGISYDHEAKINSNPLENKRIPVEGDINIFMFHYSLEKFRSRYMYSEPIVFPSSFPKNLHYIACGHVHRYMCKRYGETLLCYPGSSERLSFQEERDREKGFIYLEVGLNGVEKINFIPVKARPMKSIRINISENISNPSYYIVDLLNKYANKNIIFRAVVEGELSLEALQRYDRNEIFRKLVDKFFILDIVDDKLILKNIDIIPPDDSYRSPIQEFKKYMETLIEKERDEERKKLWEDVREMGERKLREAGGF